jgi:hypothetical protein
MKATGLLATGAGILLTASSLVVFDSLASPPIATSGRAPMQPASPAHVGKSGHGTTASNATQSSLDWAGYAATGAVFSNVAGSWKQPTATCPKNQVQQAAFWVGIDGFSGSDPTVEQVGTDSDCTKGGGKKGGGPSYYAWFEMYPHAVVVLSGSTYPVVPGDLITASVSVSGLVYTLTVSDGSKWHFSTNQTSQTRPQNSSAEWIAEAPSSCTGSKCKALPLANFGSMAFTSASANHRVISAPGFTDYQITMVAKNSKTTKAQPSALAFGGSAFAIAWLHN